MSTRCVETGLSASYGYKQGCRCAICRAQKAKYTATDVLAPARSRAWVVANPERAAAHSTRGSRQRRDLNYKTQIALHGKLCGICGAEFNLGIGHGPRLHLDHDHLSGKIRGLLCGGCNVGLGHFRDDLKLLRNATLYLEKHQC